MKRGLIIGKFMPLHEGHLAMIRFAAQKCDELIVSMSYAPSDPIDGPTRFSWIVEIFKDHPKVRPELTIDTFDNDHLPVAERTRSWADYIKKRMPPLDFVVSSEEYGHSFAGHLGIAHYLFDPERKQVPVSASLIRKNPFHYWNFIPPVVRPYFVKKICFYGPESTGKSSLAKHFAALYRTEYVPEVARELIQTNEFSVEDIIRIGEEQTGRVIAKLKTANRFLFCDTDVITTEIYSQYYLKTVPPVLAVLEKSISYDLYFLLDIDIPWEADGMRDLGEKRSEMYQVFKSALDERGIQYIAVSGSWDQRVKSIGDRLYYEFQFPETAV